MIGASGTGGHIYPGISIAAEIKERGYNPVFFISGNSISLNIIQNSPYQYEIFNISGMPKILSLNFPFFCLKLLISTVKAFVKIKSLKSKKVIAMGGYIGFPAIIAAKFAGAKTFIHEQNALAGKANRFLNSFADIVFISFKNSAHFFDANKTVFSGYPVRKDIFISRKEAREKLNLAEDLYIVLVFGGSLGAAKINEAVFETSQILPSEEKAFFLHICGERNYEDFSKKTAGKSFYRTLKYMNDIGIGYGAADLIISRSGAGAISEISALNKPAILIPFAAAAQNHQFHNALEIQKENFIEIILEKDLSAQILADTLLKIKNSSQHKCFNLPSILPILPQKIISDALLN
jgi:UDP-N-acetylglucosamine--N-acetylmuramyl-(pentapeptide) pyrophosphoryl-undecaprenol N-acetylglucosamine transferase